MLILKEEINDTLASALDLVKWKLIVLATLTAAGVGVLKDVGNFNQGYLLLFFAPFVCLYVDLLVYERVARVHYIAKYLREYSGADHECKELQRWERYIDKCRTSRQWLPHEGTARFASSLVASVCIPLLALCVDKYQEEIGKRWWVILLPIIGSGLVIWVHLRGEAQDRELAAAPPPDQADP